MVGPTDRDLGLGRVHGRRQWRDPWDLPTIIPIPVPSFGGTGRDQVTDCPSDPPLPGMVTGVSVTPTAGQTTSTFGVIFYPLVPPCAIGAGEEPGVRRLDAEFRTDLLEGTDWPDISGLCTPEGLLRRSLGRYGLHLASASLGSRKVTQGASDPTCHCGGIKRA